LSAEARASLPQHVAVIMDGNGRWAKQRGCRASRGTGRARNPAARTSSARRAKSASSISRSTLFFGGELESPQDEVERADEISHPLSQKRTPELNKSNRAPRSHRPDLSPAGECAGDLKKSIATLPKTTA